MYRKLLLVSITLIFLVVSVGLVFAEDSTSISVKVAGDVPGQVTVNLLCDGRVVDTATLNSVNGWNKTFTVNSDGNYQIKADAGSGYSLSVSGNAVSGFVINSKLVKQDTLGASPNEDTLGNNSSSNGNGSGGPYMNEPPLPTEDDNGTGDKNSSDDKNNTLVTPKKNETPNKVAPPKHKPPKPPAKPKHDTGLPIALVIVAMAAIFIPLGRKK